MWTYYYFPKAIYLNGWIITPFTMVYSFVSATIIIWVAIGLLWKFADIKETLERYWAIGINVPIIIFHLLTCIFLVRALTGSVFVSAYLLAQYLSGFCIFVLFGLPFVTGFYCFLLKGNPLSKYADIAKFGIKESRLKGILFGISAPLILITTTLLFVGQYLGWYHITL